MAPSPLDPAVRERAVRALGPLDAPEEERFAALVRLAARSCHAPVAAFALADAQRLWFRSLTGADVASLPLEQTFCATALAEPDGLLVVPDALQDPRFAALDVVTGAPHLRFYAGRVLRDGAGTPLGTLCVFDVAPRPGLTPEQADGLQALAAAVEAQLELGRTPARRPAPAVATRLRRAVAAEELVAHFQPLWGVSPHDGGVEARLVGAEALVRWEHPEEGLLLPGRFLPDLEAIGLATALGELVLRSSLRSLARWEAEGRLTPEFRLHVNVAASQLHDGGVAALLRRLGAETGAPLHRLCLEITETALLDATAFPPSAAQEIVDLGVRLVLDDFGTGYSSLSLLRRYPLAGVKVDRSFVQGLGRAPQDEVIVGAVVAMAHRLGLEAVCEGVETLEQLTGVMATGAGAVQGFLLGRASAPQVWEGHLLPVARRLAACS